MHGESTKITYAWRVPRCRGSILGVKVGEGSAKDVADGGGHGEAEELGGGGLRRIGRLKKVGFGFTHAPCAANG